MYKNNYRPNSIEECYANILEIKNYFNIHLYSFDMRYYEIENSYYNDINFYNVDMANLAYLINGFSNRVFHVLAYAMDYLFPCETPKKKRVKMKYESNGYIYTKGLQKMLQLGHVNKIQEGALVSFTSIRNEAEHRAELIFKDFIITNRSYVFEMILSIIKLMQKKVNEIKAIEFYNNRNKYHESMNSCFNNYSENIL